MAIHCRRFAPPVFLSILIYGLTAVAFTAGASRLRSFSLDFYPRPDGRGYSLPALRASSFFSTTIHGLTAVAIQWRRFAPRYSTRTTHGLTTVYAFDCRSDSLAPTYFFVLPPFFAILRQFVTRSHLNPAQGD